MKLNKKNIIVLGSGGNLGMYYLDYLLNNLDTDKYELIATGTNDRYPFTFYNGNYIKLDITNRKDFEKLPTDNVAAIVDFAGVLPAYKSNIDGEKYFNVNTIGMYNILEYCIKVNADRIIYMQTWADLNGYLNEGKPLSPYLDYKPIRTGDHAVYCISKIAAVELMKDYFEQYGLKYYIFRLPNIYLYSPTMFYYVNGEKKYISYRYMIEKAKNGENIELWGNPNRGKDIVYVKDLCGMIYNAMFTEHVNGIYNVGTGVKTTMLEQIEGIIKVFCPDNKKSEIMYCPEKRDCDDFVMDIDNIKKELNYVPKYDYISYLKDYKKEEELNRFLKRR